MKCRTSRGQESNDPISLTEVKVVPLEEDSDKRRLQSLLGKHRDRWIGWTRAQRDRRLSLVANNSRFLILPDAHQPNLGSRVLSLALDRLSSDWQARYAHPVLVVETFVDPEQFQGTV
ncbi:MAG: Druantia anti-phage system protein DruA [Verrucomicrobiota bacterium]